MLWGTSATLARWAMKQDIPPLHIVELRLAISVVLLAIAFLFKPAMFKLARADVLPLVILGTVGIAAVQGTYYSNVGLVGVGLAILLQYLAPTLVVVWVAIATRRAPAPARVLALVLATLGTALLVLADGAQLARANPLGVALGLASAGFFAFYIVYAKHVLARVGPWTVLFYGFLVALLFWMIFVPPVTIACAGYEPRTWLVFLAIGLGSALIPFGLFYEGLKRLDAPRAGIVALLEPIVAIGSSAWWLGEGLSWSQGVGAALILLGVFLVARSEQAA